MWAGGRCVPQVGQMVDKRLGAGWEGDVRWVWRYRLDAATKIFTLNSPGFGWEELGFNDPLSHLKLCL